MAKKDIDKIEELADQLEQLTKTKYGDKVQRVFNRLFSADVHVDKEIKRLKDLIELNTFNDELEKRKLANIDITVQERVLRTLAQTKVKSVHDAVMKDKSRTVVGAKALYGDLANTFSGMDGHSGNIVSNTYRFLKGVTYSAPVALINAVKLRGNSLDAINKKLKALKELKKFYAKQLEYAKQTDNKTLLLETQALLNNLNDREVVLMQRAGIESLEEVLTEDEEGEEKGTQVIKKAYKNYAQRKREEQQNDKNKSAYKKKRESSVPQVNLENIKTNKVNEKEQDVLFRLKSVERILGTGAGDEDIKNSSALKKLGVVWLGANLVGFVSLGLKGALEKINAIEDKLGLQHDTPYNPISHPGFSTDIDAIQKNLDAYKKTHPDKKGGGAVGAVSNFFSNLMPTVTQIKQDPRENASFVEIDGAKPGKKTLTNVETPLSMNDFERYLSFPASEPHVKAGYWKMVKKLQTSVYNLAKDPLTRQVLGNVKISVNSTFRDPALQEELMRIWIAQGEKYTKGDRVRAKPAKNSKHSRGLAIDIDAHQADALDANGLLKKHGLKRPFNNPRARYYDPVHIILLDDSNSDVSDFDVGAIDDLYKQKSVVGVQADNTYYERIGNSFGFKNGGKGAEVDTNMVAVTDKPKEIDGMLNIDSGKITLPTTNGVKKIKLGEGKNERIVLGKGKNKGVIKKARQKLKKTKPKTIEQTPAIEGVKPAIEQAPKVNEEAKPKTIEQAPKIEAVIFKNSLGENVQLSQDAIKKIWKDGGYSKKQSFEQFVKYINEDDDLISDVSLVKKLTALAEGRQNVDMKAFSKSVEIKKEAVKPTQTSDVVSEAIKIKTEIDKSKKQEQPQQPQLAMPGKEEAQPDAISPNIIMNSLGSIAIHQKL